MKPKTLLVLLGVAIALGLFIAFFERDLPSTDEREALDQKVLGLEEDEVEAVVLRADGAEVRLDKTVDADDEKGDADDPLAALGEDTWEIAGLGARADGSAVSALVRSLVELEKVRTIDGELDREAAGLVDARAEIVVVAQDGTRTLRVGTDVPLSDDALLEVVGPEGEMVVQTALGTTLLADVRKPAGDWRDRSLFHGLRSQIREVALARGDEPSVRLVREGDRESFLVTEPISDLADGAKVRGLLTTISGMEARSFLDQVESGEASEDFGLTPPRATITVQRAGEVEDEATAPFTVELGAPRPEDPTQIAARVDGQLVTLAAPPWIEAIERTPDAWRSLAWTRRQVFEVDQAIFEPAEGEAVGLVREGAEWRRLVGEEATTPVAEGDVPGGEAIPYTAASNVLYAIAESNAVELLDREAVLALGVDPSATELTITLVTDDGEDVLRLHGVAGDGEGAVVSAEGRNIFLLLASEDATEVRTRLGEVRTAAPEPPPTLDLDAEVDDQGEDPS